MASGLFGIHFTHQKFPEKFNQMYNRIYRQRKTILSKKISIKKIAQVKSHVCLVDIDIRSL